MNVLCIATHPDDETLGCGGTLLNHIAAGDRVHWALVTACREPDYSQEEIVRQAAQVETVKQAYPFETLDWIKFPTKRLEVVPFNDLVQALLVLVQRIRPAVVFVPNRSDVHSDHRVVFQAVLSAVKSFRMLSLGVRRVLTCEILSETEAGPPLAEHAFVPNVFVDVTATLDRKLEIMELCYKSELQPGHLPRTSSAIRALARYRGATVGLEYTEAFMLIRELA